MRYRRDSQGHRLEVAALVLAFCALAAAPLHAADEPITVAVLDFGADAVKRGWALPWSADELGGSAADQLRQQLEQSGRFEILDRATVSRALGELQVSDTGALDTETAIAIGRALRAQLVIHGNVVQFGLQKKKRGLNFTKVFETAVGVASTVDSRLAGTIAIKGAVNPIKSVNLSGQTVQFALEAQLVDAARGELLERIGGNVTKKFKKGSVNGLELGREFSADKAAVITAEAVAELASGVVERAANVTRHALCIDGDVVAVKADEIYLSVGRDDNVEVGDVFEIRRIGEAFTHPTTGEVLGVDEQEIGRVEVKAVAGEQLSIARVVSGRDYMRGDRALQSDGSSCTAPERSYATPQRSPVQTARYGR